MATNQITGSVAGNITVATGGAYTSPLTVTSTGTVTGTTTVQNSGTVLNFGSLNTGGSGNSYGVAFYAGGAITNEAGGIISGGTSSGAAIYATSTATVASTIDNFGTLSGFHGIALRSDGVITNEMGGSIVGADYGVVWRNASGVLVNDGSITATGGPFADAVNFFNGGTVTNGADGVIRGANNGVAIDGGGVVTNSGTIVGTNIWGIDLNAGGSISNSGTIAGGSEGILVQHGAGTFDNFGSVYVIDGLAHTVSSDNGAGVEFDAGGSVTNEAGATIHGGGKGVYLRDGGGTVTNLTGGTITGYQYGVKITGAAGSIDNQGLIGATADYYTPEGVGVFLGAGGTITNETGATIQGYGQGIEALNSAITIDNHGTIAATGTSGSPPIGGGGGIGIDLGAGGTIVNAAAGSISGLYIGINSNDGLTLTNASGATISSYKYVVNVNGDAGIIVNHGAILGGAFANSQAVYLGDGGSVTNDGTISATRNGVFVKAGDATVTNTGLIAATGASSVDVGVQLKAGGTVDNAGTIIGDVDSVRFDGASANRLIVHAGAVFDGIVFANSGGTNTLELASGAVGGAITALGVQYAGFQTVAIDAGASWDIGGTAAGFSGSTITGFHDGDRIDLTDIAFQAGDTASYSGGVLTIENAGHTVLASIDMTGSFGGHSFDVLSDGHSGSYVEEDGVACYCRGTLILTSRGEVPVEDLKIGDRLVTHWDAKRPIRWIGTRAYNGRFAAGRKDILPVTIAAGALGDNIPRRDLSVSPLHAMFLDGMLIPAFALVNGASITQAEHVETIEYFHIELDSHDVIVAEGALSETFVDDDSRGLFHNAAEYHRLYPAAGRKPATYCAPVVEEGEELERVRRWIAARAVEIRRAA